MNWQVVFTGQAEQDLRDIFEYIAFSLLEPEIADRQVKRIMDKVDSLGHMPERHRIVESEPWRSRGLRVTQIDNYLVFYQPIELQRTTAVIRIMYSGRDAIRQLSENTDDLS